MKGLTQFIVVIISLCMVACTKSYYYIQTNTDGYETSTEEDIIAFKAVDDSSAFRWGKAHLKKEQKKLNGNLFVSEITSLPYSFIILNRKREVVASYIPTFKDENKAYRDAWFGMTAKDLCVLPMFKDEEWLSEKGGLLKLKEQIGDAHYQVSLEFYKTELYQVCINSEAYVSDYKQHIDDARNLLSVFSLAYGNPYYNTPIPSDANHRQNIACTLARWKLGSKQVSITSVYHKGYGYAVIAYITNVEREYEKYKDKYANNSENELVDYQKASSLF